MSNTDDNDEVNEQRRRFLRGVGATGIAGVVAGCLGGDDGDNGTDTATATDSENDDGSATFEVSELDPGSPTIEAGESLAVSATIENTGDAEGSQTIEYRVDGDALAEQDLTLSSGDSETISFEGVDTSQVEVGEYGHGVYSNDGDATGTLTVEEAMISVLFLGNPNEGTSHNPPGFFAEFAPYLLDRGIELVYTERQEDLLPDTLHRYDALLQYGNRSGLPQEQEDSVVEFVENGGGFVPIHSASGTFTGSDAYIGLVGGQFLSHGVATMTTDRQMPDHPVYQGVPQIEVQEETYRHQNVADDIEVLAYGASGDFGENEEEPFTWVREQGDGRVFYTAWGHFEDGAWVDPGFKKLIENGIRWTTKNEDTIADDTRELANFEYSNGEDIPFFPGGPYQEVPQEAGDGTDWTRMQHAVSAEQSVANTVLPEGFDLEPYVTEEDFPDGIEGKIMAVDFDAAGRAYVAVTRDYPNELGEGRDAILRCVDTDGDGVADEITVFQDGLSIPTNLVAMEDGVIAIDLEDFHDDGRVIRLRDTNGDGIAEEEEELFSGFGTSDTHAGPNQLVYGIDNWIWGQVGYTGFDGEVGGEQHSFASSAFRFRPDGSELEVVSNMDGNVAGLDFSEEGLAFASEATSGNPSNYLPIPNRYYEGADGVSAPTAPSIATSNRINPMTDLVRQGDWQGGYTAASSHTIYTAREYPEKYWNRVSFISEPTGHLTGALHLEQDGASYVAHNPSYNIAASKDEWFSPIYAPVGPDGYTWLIDWYNYVMLHNTLDPGTWTPGDGNAYIQDLRDHQHGRLYRITYGDGVEALPRNLDDADASALVEALSDDNMFWRHTAQRKLVERGETDVVSDLVALIEEENVDDIGIDGAAIHALWTLDGLGAISDDGSGDAFGAAESALTHASAGARLTAARVLPASEAARDAIVDSGVLEDDDARVQMWALLKLSETPASDSVGEAIYEALNQSEIGGDDTLIDAATIAASQHSGGFVSAYEANNDTGGGDDDEPPNLLSNPTFEAADTLESWGTNTWTGSGEYGISTETSYNGDQSAMISSDSGIDGSLQQTISVEPNSTYTFSAWIKTEGLEPGGSNGVAINPQIVGEGGAPSPLPAGDNDWTQMEITFDSGNNEELLFNMTLGGWGQATGTAWFDDAKLIQEGGSAGAALERIYDQVS